METLSGTWTGFNEFQRIPVKVVENLQAIYEVIYGEYISTM